MTAVLFLLPTIILVVARRGRVDVAVLVGIPLGQWLAGAYASDVAGARQVGLIVAVAAPAFLLLALPAAWTPVAVPVPRNQWRRLRLPVTAVVLALTALHFARAGIPLLSGQVETDRFDNAASGMFGIPSRYYLYVLPAAAIWAACSVRRVLDDRCTTALWIALVVSRLAGGLKSGLLEVGIYALLVALRRRGPLRLDLAIRTRTIGWLVLAAVSAGLIGQTYGTVQARDDGSTVDYLLERLTIGTVSAAGHTVESMQFDHPPVLDDLSYYLPKYVGLPPQRPSMSRQIVSSFYGLPVSSDPVTTSVTLSLPVELYINGGLLAAVLGCVCVALLLRGLQRRFLAATNWMLGAIGLSIAVATRVVGNGGLVYYSANLAGSLALFAATVVGARVVADAAGSRSARQTAHR